jgi:hypothetical protein
MDGSRFANDQDIILVSTRQVAFRDDRKNFAWLNLTVKAAIGSTSWDFQVRQVFLRKILVS